MNPEDDENKIEKVNALGLSTYKPKNVGFVSTRLAGTDGVSLEAAKWASIFEKEGLSCFYFAGECDRHQSIHM